MGLRVRVHVVCIICNPWGIIIDDNLKCQPFVQTTTRHDKRIKLEAIEKR